MASKTQYFCDICSRESPALHNDIAIGDDRLTYKIPGKDWLTNYATHVPALVCDHCRSRITAALSDIRPRP